MPLPWILHSTKELLRTRIFRLVQTIRSSPRTGEPHDFYVIETPDWINVIPLTAENRVVLIRQYRHGLDEVTLEIPGGMMDPEDDDPATAAHRELLEETGLRAGRLEYLGVTAPNPAIMTNRCHTFLATDLQEAGAQSLDSTEEIEVEQVPLQEISRMILDGRIDHALVVVAFCHLFGLSGVPRPLPRARDP